MTFPRIAILFVLLLVGPTVLGQTKYDYLKSWSGAYPTYNKSGQRFFNLPEVREPLRKLLPNRIYFLLTRGHTKEGPLKLVRNYLTVLVCGSPKSYRCDNQTMFVMNLDDGSMYVAFNFDIADERRDFATKGNFSDLPSDVRAGH